MDKDKLKLYDNNSNIDEKEYMEKYQYLFDKQEYFSDKLKKYHTNYAQKDLQNDITLYHRYLAEARLSFKENIVVYKLKQDLIEKIKNTKIDTMPDEIPALLKKPFIIETIENNQTLFGDVNAIIGFYMQIPSAIIDAYKNDVNSLSEALRLDLERMGINKGETKVYTIFFHTIDHDKNSWFEAAKKINSSSAKTNVDFQYLGLNSFHWTPNMSKTDWEFSKKNYKRNVLTEGGYCETCPHDKICNDRDIFHKNVDYHFCFEGICDNIMSFLTVFNYMMEAENSPIVQDKIKDSIKRTVINKKRKVITKNEDWIINYLYIDETKIKHENDDETKTLNKENHLAKEVQVRGHLRHQAYGTGFSKRRWIYIESFITTKWIKEGDRKIIVTTHKEAR
jgi:hypothetical protein